VQESIAALATNVRSLRESHGLSLAQLAERSGAAKATLFKIEQQRTNPTLETLMALARTFSVTVGDLLAVPDRPTVEIVRPRDGMDISDTAIGGRLLKSLLVGSTLIEVLELTIHRGRSETSVSHGAGAREHVIVQKGRLTVGPLDAQVEIGAGDYATYPSDRPHRWAAIGNGDARVWVVHTFPRPVPGRTS